MLTPIQNRLIRIHLKNLLTFFIEAVNYDELSKVNEYKNTINQTINILIEKSDLPREIKEKLVALKKAVNNESDDVGSRYNAVLKSL